MASTNQFQMQEKQMDGRLVIEITGVQIVISALLIHELEGYLIQSSAEEVRIIATECITIDANLKQTIWHGKNIVVLADSVTVSKSVTWDVSGADNDHVYHNNAGTDEDGNGVQGHDGFPGESGGNVLILTNSIENAEYLTIQSNGGKGSKGQDGGHGRDGENGKGMETSQFFNKFPVTALFDKYSRKKPFETTIDSIEHEAKDLRTQWIRCSEGTKNNLVLNYARNVAPCCSIFLEAVTSEGNEITFSFEYGNSSDTNCQSFVLYKGSPGKAGGNGGKRGLGGQGGYAGQITVTSLSGDLQFEVNKFTQQGEDGKPGVGGLYGNYGKNGWDIGYTDYSVSKFFTENWPKYYGLDHNSKLTIEYQKENSSSNVYCPYKDSIGHNQIYATIKQSAIGITRQAKYTGDDQARDKNDRKHYALATRKNVILESTIRNTYADYLYMDKKEQRQKESSTSNGNWLTNFESRTMRHVHFVPEANYFSRKGYSTQMNSKYHDANVAPNMIDLLTIESNAAPDALLARALEIEAMLQTIALSIFQFQPLFCYLENVKKSINVHRRSKNDTLERVEKLIIEKYRIATLEQVARVLPNDGPESNHYDLSLLTPEEATRFLIEDLIGDNKISHDLLGRLDQYLFVNSHQERNLMSVYCREELPKNLSILGRALELYISEAGKSLNAPDCIKTYFEEYSSYFQYEKWTVSSTFDDFISQLSMPKNAHFLSFMEERNNQMELNTRNDIENAKYFHLIAQHKFIGNWWKCCNDEKVRNQLCDYIQNTGVESQAYRELLALVFDVNFRIYSRDSLHELILQENLNTTSKTAVYLLHQATGFVRLGINEKHFHLQQERQKQDSTYQKLLTKIRTLNNKQGLDQCLTSTTFWEDIAKKRSTGVKCADIDPQLIVKYFPEEDRAELKMRLSKMGSEYIEQEGILYYLEYRFSREGIHVSCEEMYFLINFILSYCLAGVQVQYTFAWLIAAYPQRNWIDELVLLHLENYFTKLLNEKSKWRSYLSKIRNKEVVMLLSGKLDHAKSLTIDRMETILYLLSNIQSGSVPLEALELPEWPYVLKEKYWLNKLDRLCNAEQGCEDLSTASYYVLSIENMYTTAMVENLLNIFTSKVSEANVSPNKLVTVLSNFHNAKWNLSEGDLQDLKNASLDEWMDGMNDKYTTLQGERKIPQLVALIRCNGNSSEPVKNNLAKIEESINRISNATYAVKNDKFGSLEREMYVEHVEVVAKFTEEDINIWLQQRQHSIKGDEVLDCHEILAVINRAVELKRGFSLRDTQKLAVLALLANDRSTLAQVSTGEGKSLIVVAASIVMALGRQKVDVITSSPVLAKRDAENNHDIYRLFGITVSHNCSEDVEKRTQAYSIHQVVYGDLGSFQRDYLLDRFYGKNILADRNFTNVIVDEVDSMLVDKGNNMLYLSHGIPWMDKLESVFLFIWQWINRPEEIAYTLDEAIEEEVLSDIYGMIREKDIRKIDVKLTDRDCRVIWTKLVKAQILDERGRPLVDIVDETKLSEVLGEEFSKYEDRVRFFLLDTIGRERLIPVPNYLRSFVERHLRLWIRSAKTAFFMNPGQNYVLDIDRTGTSSDRNANVIILDRDTGTDQANSQWDEALHQFLQLKHGCRLSMLSLKAVFISNVSYFKLYRHLYGLTGTLGSKTELDLLREIHEVDFVTIPTAHTKQFHETPPIICCNKEAWITSVCNQALLVTTVEKRSVLIICETVKDVQILYRALAGQGIINVHCYERDYEEFTVASGNKLLDQGQVIVATNLAGRGTDIQITNALRNAGGLHVCLTYLPGNKRIEEQAFGRAARSGDKGSGQLIVVCSKEDEKKENLTEVIIWDMKKERDIEEALRVSEIKSYYNNRIIAEENCFKKFKDQYEQLKKKLNEDRIPYGLQDILLKSCLDRWAFWLDEHSDNSRCEKDGEKANNYKQLSSSFERLFDGVLKNEAGFINTEELLPWVDGMPAQMVKLAKYLSQQKLGSYVKLYETCLKLYERVIQSEPFHSEAAHYYKAFVIGKNINWEKRLDKNNHTSSIEEFKQELRTAGKLFDTHSKLATSAAATITNLILYVGERSLRVKGYEEQKDHVANLYSKYVRSIDDILGHFITPESLKNDDMDIHTAEYLMEELLTAGILLKATVEKENISQKNLTTVGQAYGITSKMLKHFLSQYALNVDEVKFEKDLKQAIALPSREQFWKILVSEGALYETVSYVIVDKEKMELVDPSLLDFVTKQVDKDVLKRETIKCTSEQMVLYATDRPCQQENFVFGKVSFIEIVGRAKYKFLKERKILSFNKKASINATKLRSVHFPCFDSITMEDLIEHTSITSMEAETILSELVQHKVLRKHAQQTGLYALAINIDEMPADPVLSCSVYESIVRNVLSVCFSYRLVLQTIIQQLEEGTSPIRLELQSRPHRSLFFYLMEQKLINPIKVMDGDIEHKWKQHFKQNYTKQEIKALIHPGIDAASNKYDELFDILLQSKWILPATDQHFCIADASKRSTPLQVITNLVHREAKVFADSSQTIEKQFDNRLMLTKNDRVFKHVMNRLKCLRGSLHMRKTPAVAFTSLLECDDLKQLSNQEEVRLFFINGIDQLIHLEEQKWTRVMLFNTGIVVAMGIAQFAIGVVLEFAFAGIIPCVGIALMNEGINDLIYATTACFSGYFSWQDYAKHKLRSVCLSAVTVGIAGLASKFARVARFAYKLYVPSLNTVAEEVGSFGVNQIATRVLRQTMFNVATTATHYMTETREQSECAMLERECLTKPMEIINEHSVLDTLQQVYFAFGEDEAWAIVSSASESTFIRKRHMFEYVSKIRDRMIDAISHNKIAKPVTRVSSRERSMELAQICRVTYTLLNDLELKMKTKLDESILALDNPTAEQTGRQGYENFKKKVVAQWEELLREKIVEIIPQYGTHSTTKEGAVVEKSSKDMNFRERFKNRKRQQKGMLDRRDEEPINKLPNHTQKYHKDLLTLMSKTRNPSLLAAIVRENVPMNVTCASACTFLTFNLLLRRGVILSALKVVIEGENGVRQAFTNTKDEVVEKVICVRMQDNLYKVSASDSQTCVDLPSTSRCLFQSLTKKIPELHGKGNSLKHEVSAAIAIDPVLQYIIRQYYHNLPKTLVLFGSLQATSYTINSESYLEMKNNVDVTGESSNQNSQMMKESIGQIDTVQNSVVKKATRVKVDFPDFCELFKNCRGKTLQVKRYAYIYKAVVTDINNLQREFESGLNSIDYKLPLSIEGRTILRNYKQNYEAILTKHINNVQRTMDQSQPSHSSSKSYKTFQYLKRARHSVIQTSVQELFECGKISFKQ